jgi:uncharacterized tellurite resistance protein B-like protein
MDNIHNDNIFACQAELMLFTISADGKATQEEFGAACTILATSYGPGITVEAAQARLAQHQNAILETCQTEIQMKERIGGLIGTIKTLTTLAERKPLYLQLEMIARADGLSSEEVRLLSVIRKGWELPENIFEESVKSLGL